MQQKTKPTPRRFVDPSKAVANWKPMSPDIECESHIRREGNSVTELGRFFAPRNLVNLKLRDYEGTFTTAETLVYYLVAVSTNVQDPAAKTILSAMATSQPTQIAAYIRQLPAELRNDFNQAKRILPRDIYRNIIRMLVQAYDEYFDECEAQQIQPGCMVRQMLLENRLPFASYYVTNKDVASGPKGTVVYTHSRDIFIDALAHMKRELVKAKKEGTRNGNTAMALALAKARENTKPVLEKENEEDHSATMLTVGEESLPVEESMVEEFRQQETPPEV